MKKYTFLVFHKEYEAFLQMLRAQGVVHISEKGQGVAQDEKMQQLLVREKELHHIIDQQAPDQLITERAEVAKKLQDATRQLNELTVWGDFSSDKLEALALAGHKLHFFVCQKTKFQEEWGTVVAEKSGNLYFVSIEGVVALDAIEQAGITEVILEKSPGDVRAEIDGLNGLLTAADARIEAWRLQGLKEAVDELHEVEQQIQWQSVVLSTDKAADDALCLLEGYCPIDNQEALNAALDHEHIYYQAVDPILTDNTPVQLKNNRFTKLFEVFTGMYGWPTYGEFDPTPILAPFYLLFFSMCMGDAGYGIALIAFGLAVHYRKINIAMFEGLGPIITVLGVGTLLVGFVLGTFFGMPLLEASWYPESLKKLIISGEIMGYDAQMVLAVMIGVFHICLAMVVKAICYTKRFGFRENLSTWGWTLLVVGGVILAAIAAALNLPAELTKWLVIGLAIVSALGIYIFNTPGRNPLINIGAGLWDTYNMATGLLGDVLSYIRLYALGLAGGMLGGAFNNLALMPAGGSLEGATWQWLPFVLIVLLGHVLNVAMSALGAFVHPLRLTFVEYFKNAGYEGKGSLYSPFKK
ncbi:MAG: ATPase V [Paludibacteraceae bacterium]|nr:ATPase V [Paludibacteraceae bacterium]